jgi:tRNA(adenine34) deaminase
MVYPVLSDEYFMNEALKEAHKAMEMEEVPVGAVVVNENRIIARAHNMTQQLNDVTAHAEMIAITSATNYLGAKYLVDCTLFASLEPCVMCASALKWAQLDRLVFAASDPKEGFSLVKDQILHKKTKLIPGILEKEASQLLKDFFQRQREIKN